MAMIWVAAIPFSHAFVMVTLTGLLGLKVRVAIIEFYALTTLIPTVAYLAVLLFWICAKFVALPLRGTTMYLFERATEDEPQDMRAFTLVALVLSVLAALAKLLHQLLS